LFARLNRGLETPGNLSTTAFLEDLRSLEHLLHKYRHAEKNKRRLVYSDLFKSGLALCSEDTVKARSFTEKAIAEAEELSFHLGLANAFLLQSRVELKSRNPAKALAALSNAEEAAERANTKSFDTWIHVLRVRARVQQNEHSRALAVYESLKTLEAPGATYGVQLAALSLGPSTPSGGSSLPWKAIAIASLLAGLVGFQLRRREVMSTLSRASTLAALAPSVDVTALSGDRSSTVETADTSGVETPDPPPRGRHLGGRSGDTEIRSPFALDAPQVALPPAVAEHDALGDVVAVESADGTAVWAQLFAGEPGEEGAGHGPRLLVLRDGGRVELARAGGAIGVVVGETSREQLPLPAPADVQWAGNGDAVRCRTWGELHATLHSMGDRADGMPDAGDATTQVADFLARSSVGHVEVRTDGESALDAHFVDRRHSAYTGGDAVPVLLWHRVGSRGPYRGAAWPRMHPPATQVYFGDLETGAECAGPRELIELFARTLSVVSPEHLALRTLQRAARVGPQGHVLVSGPGCRPAPDRWVLSTVEMPGSSFPSAGDAVPVVVRSQSAEVEALVN
jgi:hypothetical protein